MAGLNISTKRLQIDQANLTVIVATSIATFLVVFALFAGKALLDQRAYQAKVISKKTIAKKQLEANVKSADQLQKSYAQFIGSTENVIGGASKGTSDRDGDNAKIILDALPSRYDFPALTSSLEKLAVQSGLTIKSIKGTDDEANQQTQTAIAKPVEMPFTISLRSNYDGAKAFVNILEASIRPFQITGLTFTAERDGAIAYDVLAQTYYQPAKTLNIRSEVVR